MNPFDRKPKTTCALVLIIFLAAFWAFVVWGVTTALDWI